MEPVGKPRSYEPTVFENHVKDVVVDDTPVELSLWDTAGQEDFDRLRSLSYADTHVVLLCFSVDQPTSLENWIDEILELCPGVKLCLVALKCDLREDPATQAKLARAKMDRGVGEAFQEAARVAISARRKGETRGSDNPDLGVKETWIDKRPSPCLSPSSAAPLCCDERASTSEQPSYGYSSGRRESPSPPDNYLDMNTQQQQHNTAPPSRPFHRDGSSSVASSGSSTADEGADAGGGMGGRGGPYQSQSHGSLPRYSSGQSSSSSTNYLPNPSPLNPTAARGGPPSRYNSHGYNGNGAAAQGPGGNAHPLSNAMYLDSSPTLAGSEPMTPGGADEKSRLTSNDQLGDYVGPALTSGGAPNTGSGGAGGDAPYRRGPKPTGLTALYRSLSGASIADSGKDERHVKLPRLGYLDGLKFIAAWVVLNGTLFDATLTSGDYSFIQRNSPLYITRSTGLGITFLLLLSGRSLITPLWDVPSPSSASNAPVAKSKSALISWARLTRAMLVRPFRFILPVLVVVALQWGLAATGRTKNCNAVGMDEPYWGLVSSFAGYATLVFDLFTDYEQDTLAGQTFAGNLWTMPWFFQSSFAVYVTHLMLGNLSSNRYWVYALLAFFSWTTYNYLFVAFIGLAIADMHAHGHLHTIRTKWPAYQRLSLHAVLIAVALVTQWVPVVRDNINKGLAVINVQDHPELTFCDAIFASCWLLAIETSGIAQTILGNVVMRTLGKLSAGLFLLAPAITFTLVPNIALNLHNNGSSASSVLGVSWVVLFFVALACSVLFHFAVELPSKWAGEVVAEILEGNFARAPGSGILRSADGKLLKRNVGGGAKLAKPVLV
ncbi:hypothetical protein RQP46_004718 [Phenoliferia psychrophenolica]